MYLGALSTLKGAIIDSEISRNLVEKSFTCKMHQQMWMFLVHILLSNAAFAGIPLWLDKDPFNIWQHRLGYHNLKQLSVTEETIDRASYNYGQNTFRVLKFFHKVLRGENIRLIVIGGSNSAGGGISDHRQLYHQLFLYWWNNLILPFTGSKLTIKNLSLGGTGSDFFSLCLQNYLMETKEPDIVLIELSVNDYGYLYGDAAQPMEQLTRRVMSFSSEPLVVYVALVDLIEKVKWWKSILNPRCHNLEDIGQHEIARYYNITVLSWRDIVCQIDSKKSKRRIDINPGMINADHIHIGVKSHAQIAMMLTRYFQKELKQVICLSWNSAMKTAESIDNIPPLFVNFFNQTLISKSLCWSLISTNWKMPDERQSLNVSIPIRKGFHEITPQSICAKMTRSDADRSDSFGGWQSRKEGSFIEFSFTAPKIARKTDKWSVGLVLRNLQNGQVKISLDENESTTLIITGKSYGRILLQTRIYFLRRRITSGKYKVKIETEGQKDFEVLLSGMVLVPADMKNIKGYKPANTLQKVWSHEDYKALVLH